MNRGLSCRISEGHRLWELGYATKEIEKRSPLNASDPQSEAVTKRGSLRAALVSLNHERLAIVYGRRWAPVLSAQPRQTETGTQPGALEGPKNVITSGLTQACEWRGGGKSASSRSGSAWSISRYAGGSCDDCC